MPPRVRESASGRMLWRRSDAIGLGDSVRQSGGRVTGGAIRWRDGTWLRRPSAQRIVAALGEPLVVVRRSVLTDILRAALPSRAVETGLSATAVAIDESSVRITLSDGQIQAGGCGRRSGRRQLDGGAYAERAAAQPLRRVHRVAGGGRLRIGSGTGRRDHGRRCRGRARATRTRPHVLVRHRAGTGGCQLRPAANMRTSRRSWRAGPTPFPGCRRRPTRPTSCATISTTGPSRSTGRAAARSSSAMPRTRCVPISGRADVRALRTPRSWPGSSTWRPILRPRSTGSANSGSDGSARWSVNRRPSGGS